MRRQAVGALVVAAVLGATACQVHGGASTPATQTTVTAKRADLVVSVRGLGKLVEARAAGFVAVHVSTLRPTWTARRLPT